MVSAAIETSLGVASVDGDGSSLGRQLESDGEPVLLGAVGHQRPPSG